MAPIVASYGVRDAAVAVEPMLDGYDEREAPSWERRHWKPVGLAVASSLGESGETDTRFADDGDHLVALDGRLDNRDELRAALTLEPAVASGDAELVARAYRRWGMDCLDHLVGAYALVVWDSTTGRLLCARDPTGLRHLFWATDGDAVLVGTAPGPVGRHPRIGAPPDHGMLAEYLTGRPRSATDAFLDGVRRVRPGERLLVEDGSVSRERYWSFGESRLADASTSGLAARFREQFRTAVAARLEGDIAPAVMMSGGLDSTGVAAVAQRASPREEPVPAISVVPDDLPGIDESTGLEAMRAAYDFPARAIDAGTIGPFDDWSLYDGLAPSHPCLDSSLSVYDAAFRTAADADRDVVLTGLGGNLLDGDRSYYLDLLANATLGRVLDELFAGALSPVELAVYGTWLARGRGTAVAEFERLHSPPCTATVPDRLARAVDLRSRLQRDDCHGFDSYEREFLYRTLTDPYLDFARHAARRLSRRHGVKQRHPFLDVRVVDVLFSLPPGCRYREGTRKHLYRTAMADALPEQVLGQRTTANDYGEFLRASYVRNADEIASFTPRALRSAGAVSEAGVASLSGSAEVSVETARHAWRVRSAERWLRCASAR